MACCCLPLVFHPVELLRDLSLLLPRRVKLCHHPLLLFPQLLVLIEGLESMRALSSKSSFSRSGPELAWRKGTWSANLISLAFISFELCKIEAVVDSGGY
jgi:hypothetical protein